MNTGRKNCTLFNVKNDKNARIHAEHPHYRLSYDQRVSHSTPKPVLRESIFFHINVMVFLLNNNDKHRAR